MIELAPSTKSGLTLANPVILAAGGFSTATLAPSPLTRGREGEGVGAIVTLPRTRRARAGAAMPRVVEIPGGVLMRTGAANPGVARAVREFHNAWTKSTIPIIVALAAQDAEGWGEMAQQFGSAGIAGLELHLNPTINAADAIRRTHAAADLPILAKLDLENAREIAADCIAAGASALVIGRAPRAMAMVEGKPWFGRLYSPSVKPIVLRAVAEIAALNLNAPIVACGSIHSADDARDFLSAGASAVEIESAEWVEPGIAARVAEELNRDRV